jgi:hypothetical protein
MINEIEDEELRRKVHESVGKPIIKIGDRTFTDIAIEKSLTEGWNWLEAL